MKIGIMLDKLVEGSYSKIAIMQAKYLQMLGHDVTILIIFREKIGGYRYGDISSDIKFRFLSDKFPFIFKKSVKFPIFSFFSTFHLTSPFVAPKTIKKGEFDVIISHGTYTSFTSYAIWKRCKIPYISYIHDPISYILPKAYSKTKLKPLFSFLVPLGKKLDKMILNESLIILTQGSVHEDRLKKITKKPVIPLPFGCEPLKVLPEKRGNFILAVTKWDIGKIPEFLLDVLEKLDNKNVELYIAGFWAPPSLQKKFEMIVKKRNLKNKVHVTGPISEGQLNKLYLSCRFLIHPIIEAYGMTAIEAASFGSPFIFPKGSGVSDIFKHRVHGFFPEKGNLSEFVGYSNLLVNNEKLAWRMGNVGWDQSKKFSWLQHCKSLVKIISESLSDRRVDNNEKN